MIKHVLTNYHKYRRLKIELDLIDSLLSEDYPVLLILTKHLRKDVHNINELKKELEEKYGTNKL